MKEIVTSETKRRSVAKLISFKITEVVISTLLIWTTTGNYAYTIGLPLLIEGIQAVAIFFVERGWTRIQWGKVCSNCHFYLFHEKRKEEGKPHD
jgi:hypothetical protein